MNLGWLFSYVGLALLYAAILTLGLTGLGRLFGWRGMARAWPAAFVTLFFIMLTQHPFPDPATLQCPVPYTEPQLHPFEVVQRTVDHWHHARRGWRWLLGSWLLAPLMNLLLCVVLGVLVARQGRRPKTVLLLGFGLSLAIEVTQLTGLWGLYPCPYRQFDVDDLILNTAGAALGSALVRWWGRSQPASPRTSRRPEAAK